SSKGSAVHIAQMADELFAHYGGGLLGVIGGGDLPRYQREGTREIARFDMPIPNLIDRAEAFSGWVADHLA
ncbi:glycosyltransferase family 1 protein, partial [Micromonospora aurantiaca]|nr:glycosyltransferase family 1 protein [Micromonospora aurantiaca]